MPENQAKHAAEVNPGACIPGTKYARVWVGRVKSTCKPEWLEDGFRDIGKLVEVETGFAGFAFVTFDNEDDADEAVSKLHKTHMANIGEVLVSRATQRGYEDACHKRDVYHRTTGEARGKGGGGSKGGSRGHASRRRSRSRSRRRGRSSSSRSRSPSRKRQRADRTRSPSYRKRTDLKRARTPSPPKLRPKGRSPSAGGRSKRSPSRRKSHSKSSERPQCERSPPCDADNGRPKEDRCSKSPESRHSSKSPEARQPSGSPRVPPPPEILQPVKTEREPLARPEPTAKKRLEEEPQSQKHSSGGLPAKAPAEAKVEAKVEQVSRGPDTLALAKVVEEEEPCASHFRERPEFVQFFDGATSCELLLESAPVVAIPELFVPEILDGFPNSFQSLSQDGVINLLAVFAAFVRGGVPGSSAESAPNLSVEVRQTIAINARGQRVMRKTLLVDGVRCSSEEQTL